jgi:hypothetical protein
MLILFQSNLTFFQDMMKKLKHFLKSIFMMQKKFVILLMDQDILIFVIRIMHGFAYILRKVI